MLHELVEEAKRLPKEIEELTLSAQLLRQSLHDTLKKQGRIEARVAAEVALEKNGDGKAKYGNEDARKGEVAHRLMQDAAYRELEQRLASIRPGLIEEEARLEAARYRHRTAITLLQLVAAAVQAGDQNILQTVTGNGQKDPREVHLQNFVNGIAEIREAQVTGYVKANGNGNGQKGNDSDSDLQEIEITVLEVRPGSKEGSYRF